MADLKPYFLRPELLGAIEAEYAAGESTSRYTDMYFVTFSTVVINKQTQQIQHQNWRTIVLTNRSIRFIQFAVKGLIKKQFLPKIIWSYSLPIHEIQGLGVSISDKIGMFGRPVQLKVTWQGGNETYFSTFDNANEFVKACEAAFQGKVTVEQSKMVGDAVSRLALLLEEGLISQEEFERSKQGLIGQPTSKGDEIVGLLRQLHSLKVAGVLTEGEFNMKKWDILSKG